MKYVIMCGGRYENWVTPRQLAEVKGETLVARTVRLLKLVGVSEKDILVSTNIPVIQEYCNTHNMNVLWHDKNSWVVHRPKSSSGHWCDAFYPMNEPVCYLMGDVIFSPDAIKTIVETETDDIEFFASAPPFSKEYIKRWAEPFAFKVVNNKHLTQAQEECRKLADANKFRRPPLAWEFWQVVKGTPINHIDYHNYTAINDYTCDIDVPEDAIMFEQFVSN